MLARFSFVRVCARYASHELWYTGRMGKRRRISIGIFCAALIVAGGFCAPVSAATDDDLTKKKDKLEKKISKETKKLKAAQERLTTVKKSLATTQWRVSRTEDELERIAQEIAQREERMKQLRTQLDFQKEVLKRTVREMYSVQSASPVERVAAPQRSMQYDRLGALRDRAMTAMRQISAMQARIAAIRAELAAQREKKEAVLAEQKRQREALAVAKADAAREYRRRAATLAELKRELAAVQSKLSSLLGRKVNAKDIVDAARIASKATGVRKDFLLGELVVETSLGTYTGGCTYKKTRMRDADKVALKKIAKALDINYKKVKLSCAPGFGYGGAMGVAQFMPTTWLAYERRIAAATGHNPPDPWNLTDGVMAMALYLKDKGAGKKKGEFDAARRYYCGSPRSPWWNTKCRDYARKVLYWADNYERLLK